MDIVDKIMKIAKPPRPEVLEEDRYRKEHREKLRAEAKRKLAERRKRRLQLMDKATKVAVEKYPHGTFDGELGDSLRAACAVGYMQAEKDLALTWEDMRTIASIFHSMMADMTVDDSVEDRYKEVLHRFQEYKNK